MVHESIENDVTLTIGSPSLVIPFIAEPTEEELARRQRVVARIHELSERIGSIGIASDDLLHESRKEDEE